MTGWLVVLGTRRSSKVIATPFRADCHWLPIVQRIVAGGADPATIVSQRESMPTTLEACGAFDRREPSWTKVTLELSG